MSQWNYVHANKVLPERLIKEIRQYTTGLIYIPTDIKQSRQRVAIRVRALKEQGLRNCEIARLMRITPRHVCGILKRFHDSRLNAIQHSTDTVNTAQESQCEGGKTPPSPRA